MAAVVGVLVLALVVVGLRTDANGSTRYSFVNASAWLTSLADGTISHVTGANGKVDARLAAGNGHPFQVIQGPDGAYVVDDVTGAISRIDGATERSTTAKTLTASPDVDVITGSKATYIVDKKIGSVQKVDGALLTPIGARVELGGPVGSGVVDENGVAWIPFTTKTDVARIDSARTSYTNVKGAHAPSSVVLADKQAVAVDVTTGTVQGLTDNSAHATVPVTLDALVVGSSDSAAVAIVSAKQAVVAQLYSNLVTSIPVAVKTVSQSVLAQNRLYVLDGSVGTVNVIDVTTKQALAPINIPNGKANELVATNGLVVINDKNGARAVTVDQSGRVAQVDKYQVPTKQDAPTTSTTQAPKSTTTTTARPLSKPSQSHKDNNVNRPETTSVAPTTTLPPPPGAPQRVRTAPGDGSVDVTWNAPSDNDTDVTGFAVQYGESGSLQVGGASTKATITNLQNGTEYCVRVQALYAGGAGPWSVAGGDACATPSVDKPTAPSDVQASHNDGTITVMWQAATPNRTAIDHYTVRLMPGGATKEVNSKARSATFDGLTNGINYTFTVTATSEANKTGEAASVSEKPSVAPIDLMNVYINPGNGFIGVTWGPPYNHTTMGDAVTYTITCNGQVWTQTTNFGSTQITGLANGQTYQVEVWATNRDGSSPHFVRTVTPA